MTAGRPKWSRFRRELSRANLPDNRWALDDRDNFHRPAAAGTDQRIRLVDLPDQPGPGPSSSQGCLLVPLRDCGSRVGVAEEPALHDAGE